MHQKGAERTPPRGWISQRSTTAANPMLQGGLLISVRNPRMGKGYLQVMPMPRHVFCWMVNAIARAAVASLAIRAACGVTLYHLSRKGSGSLTRAHGDLHIGFEAMSHASQSLPSKHGTNLHECRLSRLKLQTSRWCFAYSSSLKCPASKPIGHPI